jgi:tRNA(Ile)-lysidine synthase
MLEKAIKTIKQFDQISKGDKVLVGISGGPDSVALLLVLSQMTRRFGFSLVAAHLNHGLRGKKSDADEQFAREMANNLKIPFVSKKIDLKSQRRRRKGSLEEIAREERYNYLISVASRRGCKKVAVGHHADDNAETLLMNFIRGSGPKGLGGIPPVRPLKGDDILLVRPLIEVTRDEIIAFLKKEEQDFCIDETNSDTAFRRNKIRHDLVPQIKNDYNPSITAVLNDTAEVMRSVDEFIESEIQHKMDSVVNKTEDVVSFKQRSIKSIHPFIRKAIIRRVLRDNFGVGIELNRLEEISRFIQASRAGTIKLPNSIVVMKEYSDLIIRKQETEKEEFEKQLKVPGRVLLGYFGTQLSLDIIENEFYGTEPGPSNVSFTDIWQKIISGRQIFVKELFDADKIDCDRISMRNRRKGDKYCPIGLGHNKDIKSIMIDEKIPVALRPKIPLLLNGDEIMWMIGYRINEKYKITEETRKILKVEAKIFYCNNGG